jgi:hypothetical protein
MISCKKPVRLIIFKTLTVSGFDKKNGLTLQFVITTQS